MLSVSSEDEWLGEYHLLDGIAQLVEQQTFMQQARVQYPLLTHPGWGLTQPSIPLWVC